MSKKKKISNQNYMDFIVVKNPEIEYETNDKGQVTVMIEWRGFYHRIAQRFFKRPKVSAIDRTRTENDASRTDRKGFPRSVL